MSDRARRCLAEFLGTGLLVMVVIGSGIAAQTLSGDAGLQLLENAIATAAGLSVLILIFGPISGAHLNPVVSAADCWIRRRSTKGLASRDLLPYALSQTAGAIGGAILADAMFAKPLVAWSTHRRSGPNLLLSEVVATAGLLLVIFTLARAGRTSQTPWAVGAYIGGAYFFTSSTSFANPAVTVGRSFSNTFAGIAPVSVPGFVVAQCVGGVLAVGLLALLYPAAASTAGDVRPNPEAI